MAKRVFINGSILHEQPSGLGIYAENVIKQIGRKNKDIKVFCPVDIQGVEVIKITDKVKPSYGKKGGFFRFLWTQLVLPFKVGKEDILYHPFQYISFLSRARQVITIHDFIPVHYPEVAKHQYYYYKYIMPFLLRKAEKIVCISENTKKDLLDLYKVDESKIKVVYNGYDKNVFNREKKNKGVLQKYGIDKDYIIMVGAAYPHKNLESVLKAFSQIKDKTDYKVVIVGKGSAYVEKLKAMTAELNISDRVIFLGYVDGQDLPALYYFAKAFVYPTLYEGFGLPILEAAACGTAVICGDNSSLPEAAGEGAEFFDARSVESIKQALEAVLFDENHRLELIRKGEENLKNFSWEKTGEEIYNFITKG
ncbi:glycosyltransferase family 4 protein [Clostridium thermarum]|uniref:glycosyltransferase family 4 protein n=1 Tax=Clostridium thermarum TaxID=1716543 RepID=UPI0013CF516A|nr:glycosyltransferase family 1 protein [Clostridium thermarum]